MIPLWRRALEPYTTILRVTWVWSIAQVAKLCMLTIEARIFALQALDFLQVPDEAFAQKIM